MDVHAAWHNFHQRGGDAPDDDKNFAEIKKTVVGEVETSWQNTLTNLEKMVTQFASLSVKAGGSKKKRFRRRSRRRKGGGPILEFVKQLPSTVSSTASSLMTAGVTLLDYGKDVFRTIIEYLRTNKNIVIGIGIATAFFISMACVFKSTLEEAVEKCWSPVQKSFMGVFTGVLDTITSIPVVGTILKTISGFLMTCVDLLKDIFVSVMKAVGAHALVQKLLSVCTAVGKVFAKKKSMRKSIKPTTHTHLTDQTAVRTNLIAFYQKNKENIAIDAQLQEISDANRLVLGRITDLMSALKTAAAPLVSYLDYYHKYLLRHTYLSFDVFKRIYAANIQEIKEASSTKKIVLITTEEDFERSGIFFFLYMFHLLQVENIRYDYVFSSIEHFLDQLARTQPNESFLAVITDDMVYSGDQLSKQVATNRVTNWPSNVKIFLNVMGYSKRGEARLRLNSTPVIFPKAALGPEHHHLSMDVLLDMNIEQINLCCRNSNGIYSSYGTVNRHYGRDWEEGTQLLTYPFFKYPDEKSTAQALCSIPLFSPDDTDFVKPEKCLEAFRVDRQTKRNADVVIAPDDLVPITPDVKTIIQAHATPNRAGKYRLPLMNSQTQCNLGLCGYKPGCIPPFYKAIKYNGTNNKSSLWEVIESRGETKI